MTNSAQTQSAKKTRLIQSRLLFTIIMFLIFVSFLSLAHWQWRRVEQKQHLLTQLKTQQDAQPVTILPEQFNENIRYRKVKIQGTFEPEKIILLTNRIHDQQPGMDVIGLLIIKQSNKILLVNRGFLAVKSSDLKNIPKIIMPKGIQTVQGMINIPAKNFFLGENQLTKQGVWPIELQRLDLNQLSQMLKMTIYPYLILETNNQSLGFIQDWRIVNASPEKSRGYAVQWLLLALTTLIIYIVLEVKRKKS